MLFGQNIQEQADREDREMPLLVTKCIAYIEKEGLKAEGTKNTYYIHTHNMHTKHTRTRTKCPI